MPPPWTGSACSVSAGPGRPRFDTAGAGGSRVARLANPAGLGQVEPGRYAVLASLIPGAKFVPLDSANHILRENEPAWTEFRVQIRSFLPAGPSAPPLDSGLLTDREIEVLRFIAQGGDNDSIAAAMHLSVQPDSIPRSTDVLQVSRSC
jgi:Bacterial regulatory proteins, luxR family